MKRSVIYILLSCTLLYACSSLHKRFILTGNQQKPLTSDAEVKLIPWGDQKKYEKIGIAEVGLYTRERRIAVAMNIARAHGGDTIMPKEEKVVEGRGYRIESFLVLKEKKGPEPRPVMVRTNIEKVEEKDIAREPDYSNLPRATYKLLTEEFKLLKGEKFQGKLYPKKFRRTPRRLRGHTGRGKRVIQASTRRGTYRLYIIVPSDMTKKIKKMIRSGKQLHFVYTPVDVFYTGKRMYPVLEYIDEIRNE